VLDDGRLKLPPGITAPLRQTAPGCGRWSLSEPGRVPVYRLCYWSHHRATPRGVWRGRHRKGRGLGGGRRRRAGARCHRHRTGDRANPLS